MLFRSRLFHALEVVTLAAGRKESICNTEVVRSGYESEWSMSSLLIMLRQLMEAFVSASTSNTTFSILTEKDTPEGPKFSRRSLLAAVEPILKCKNKVEIDNLIHASKHFFIHTYRYFIFFFYVHVCNSTFECLFMPYYSPSSSMNSFSPYLLTYLLTFLLTYFLTYLLSYLLSYVGVNNRGDGVEKG